MFVESAIINFTCFFHSLFPVINFCSIWWIRDENNNNQSLTTRSKQYCSREHGPFPPLKHPMQDRMGRRIKGNRLGVLYPPSPLGQRTPILPQWAAVSPAKRSRHEHHSSSRVPLGAPVSLGCQSRDLQADGQDEMR